MNIWLGVATLIFIVITTVFILIKYRNTRSILLNISLFIASFVALWIGSNSIQLWLILLCSIIIGLCLLLAVVYGYNKLFTTGKVYESIGENRKPKSFGNGYWR